MGAAMLILSIVGPAGLVALIASLYKLEPVLPRQETWTTPGVVVLPATEASFEDMAVGVCKRDYVEGRIEADELDRRIGRVLVDEQYAISFVTGGLPAPAPITPSPGKMQRL